MIPKTPWLLLPLALAGCQALPTVVAEPPPAFMIGDAGRVRAHLLSVPPASRLAAGSADRPAIAWNAAANEFLVAWVVPGTEYPIQSALYAQRVGPDGGLRGPTVLVDDDTKLGGHVEVGLAYDGHHHEYLAVWGEVGGGPASDNAVGQRLTATGTPTGPKLDLGSHGAGYDARPAVAYDPRDDRYLVVSTETVSTVPGGTSIPTSVPLPIGMWALYGDTSGTTLAWDAATDGFVGAGASPEVTPDILVARRFTSTGVTTAAGTLTTAGAHPAIAYSTKDHAYVLAYDAAGPGGRDVYARRLAPAGTPSAATALGVGVAAGTQMAPALAYNQGYDRFLVDWTDARGDSLIFGQRVGAATPGLYLLGTNAGLDPAADAAPKGAPAIAYSETSHAFLTAYTVAELDHTYVMGKLAAP